MDLYRFLKKVVVSDSLNDYRFLEIIDAADQLPENDRLSENDYNIVAFIQSIVSIPLSYEKGEVSYNKNSMRDAINGYTAKSVPDELCNIIYSLDIDNLPLCIRVRLYDFLWEFKKDHKAAVKAIECSLLILDSIWDEMHWKEYFNIIGRATNIAARLNKKGKEYQNCIETIKDSIKRTKGKDPSLLSVNLFELLNHQKQNIIDDELVQCAKNIVDTAVNSENLNKQVKSIELIRRLYNQKQDIVNSYKDKLANQNILLAHEQDVPDGRKVYYLKNAIHIFRETKSPKLNEIQHELDELEKVFYKTMPYFRNTLDVSKIYKIVIQEMNKADDFYKHMRLIGKMTFLLDKESLFENVKETYTLGDMLFPKTKLDKNGHSLFTFPVLRSIENLDCDSMEAQLYMWDKAEQLQMMCGDTVLTWLYDELNNKYSYEIKDIDYLVRNNPIIPDGREDVFRNGIYLGLKGDYYSTLHILAPQMENLFRNIADWCGDITYALGDNNLSQAKTLSTVFDSPEFIDSIDENVLFCFKGLLNEKAGSNLRNEIAHGILDPVVANGGIGKYFLGIVIKYLQWYCYDNSIIDKD